MTTELNMKKTYDRVECDFIKNVQQTQVSVTGGLVGLCNVLL